MGSKKVTGSHYAEGGQITLRLTNIVETGFNVHMNPVQRDRLYCTESSHRGRLFMHLLAQSLVMILYHRVYEARQDKSQDKSLGIATEGADLEGKFLTLSLEKLRLIKTKRLSKNSDSRLVDQLSEKQRELFEEILKIKLPPRVVS